MNRLLATATAMAMAPVVVRAQTGQQQDLTQMGIEDLMKVEVTTASKDAQSLSDVPSAIYVISSDDIRRSGAVNVPEALRLAPGVNVSQIDANKWMVSIRGFNSRFSDKLLVLIDGRSVYTPLFSGVYWDAQTVPLEDIDRIEVIRGPGGSLWGSNAVNGVINIITKKASQTQGGQSSTEFGSDFKRISYLRYGGQLGHGATYRVYGQGFSRGPQQMDSGQMGPDAWDSAQGGIRIDQGGDTGNRYTFKLDYQNAQMGQESALPVLTPPYTQIADFRFGTSEVSGSGRWERNESNGRSQSLQVYFDHTDRDSPEVGEERNTYDLDYQHRLAKAGKNQFSFGLGFRSTSDKTDPGAQAMMTPNSATETLYSAFLHDTLDIKSNLRLLMGSKFEHNPYTGWEVQPNAQLLYTPDPHRTYWASVSRAVRTPTRADTGVTIAQTVIPGAPPTLVEIFGNPDFKSEEVIADEAGMRFTVHDNLFIDVSAFYDQYKNLRTFETGAPYVDPNPFPHGVIPEVMGNGLSGRTAGVETAVKWKASPRWNLSASYSIFSEKLWLNPDSTDQLGLYESDGRGGASKHMFQVHSYVDLPKRFQFDSDLYYVGALVNGNAPSYFRLDSRLGWSASPDLQLSVGVRNALTPTHVEAGETAFETIELVPRSIYFKATWRF